MTGKEPPDQIVDTTYAEGEGGVEYLELLECAEETGKCPFCLKNLPKGNRVLYAVRNWLAIQNRWPYKNADAHLLLIPAEHLCDLSEVTVDDWEDIQGLIRIIKYTHPTLAIGGALAVRFGTSSGVTIRHLHFHLIAPQTNPETGKVYPGQHVNFPIG